MRKPIVATGVRSSVADRAKVTEPMSSQLELMEPQPAPLSTTRGGSTARPRPRAASPLIVAISPTEGGRPTGTVAQAAGQPTSAITSRKAMRMAVMSATAMPRTSGPPSAS